ncbi:MAG: LexA repressor [Candidatus Xenobia bacterium]
MTREITARQDEVLNFLIETVRERGYAPSIREISAHFNLNSTQGVQRHLEALERKGFIRRDSKARAIQITPHLLEGQPGQDEVQMVPLLGEVAAGLPITAVENVEDRLPIRSDWLGVSGESFLLRVRGRSMAEAIQPGDLVLVEKRPTAQQGEIVVALIDDEATVKRFWREKERVILRSDNPDFADIVVTESQPLQLLGRVTALIRKYL